MRIKFIYDVASPNGYLCHKVIPSFEQKFGVTFDYIPCLLGGIFKLTNNQPPMIANAEIPKKSEYMMAEINRFATFHRLKDFSFNPHFPINTITIQRGALAAQETDCFRNYVDAVASGFWEQELNLGDVSVLHECIQNAGIDADAIIALTNQQRIKDLLKENTQRAVDAGAFGVPTFFIKDEMFFGKEALREMPDFISSKK